MLPNPQARTILREEEVRLGLKNRVAAWRAARPTHHHLINRSLPISLTVCNLARVGKCILRLAGCARRGQRFSWQSGIESGTSCPRRNAARFARRDGLLTRARAS